MDTLPIKLSKIFLYLLGVILLGELIFGVFRYFKPVTLSPKATSPLTLTGGVVSLASNKKIYKVSETIPVDIRVFSGGNNIVGADVSIKYDPNLIDVTDPNKYFSPGSIFDDYPQVKIDKTKGIISLSGIVSAHKKVFNGLGTMGTISFKPLKTGPTSLMAIFSKNNRLSSVITEYETGRNVLNQTFNLDLNISPSLSSNTDERKVCYPRMFHDCKDNQGRFGTYWCSWPQDSKGCNVGCFQDKTSQVLGCNIVTK